MVSPNAKGSSFERQVCRQLSMWVSRYKQSDCLWRTPNSGGRERRKRLEKTDKGRHAGDIAATAPAGELLIRLFIIECKHYADLKWHHLIYGGDSRLRKWWNLVYQDGVELERMPMLITKQNFQKPVVLLDRNGRTLFFEAQSKLKPVAVFPSEDLAVFSFADLLTEVDFRKVRKLAKREGL